MLLQQLLHGRPVRDVDFIEHENSPLQIVCGLDFREGFQRTFVLCRTNITRKFLSVSIAFFKLVLQSGKFMCTIYFALPLVGVREIAYDLAHVSGIHLLAASDGSLDDRFGNARFFSVTMSYGVLMASTCTFYPGRRSHRGRQCNAYLEIFYLFWENMALIYIDYVM